MKTLLFLLSMIMTNVSMAHEMGTAIKISGQKTAKELAKEFSQQDSEDKTFSFSVVEFPEHLKNAKAIAKYLAATFFDGFRTTYPDFCGNKAEGSLTEKYASRNQYTISGQGDGGSNSCTGEAYPGAWDFLVDVTYDVKTNSGKAHVSFYTE